MHETPDQKPQLEQVPMAQELLLKKIVAELEKAKKPASFSASGAFEFGGSRISIAGIGQIKLPIRTGDIRKLCDVAVQAPYGKRSETIVDREVRDTLEIPAHHVSCSDEFTEKLNAAVKSIASELHLEHERLDCELYKLLIYTKGGFFLPHRDSEKKKGMVASLVVVLPNKFNGGELIVQHDGRSFRFAFDAARSQTKAEFVAFFADCKHEVKKVTSGVRVCLTFNLMLKDAPKPKRSKDSPKSNAKLRKSIEGWLAHRGEKPIVFALEHLYTSAGLVPQLLKGADSILLEEMIPVADDLDCSLHFGQVSRHLCQFADDVSFGYGRRGYSRFSGDYSQLDIGETYNDEIVIDGWKDMQGKSKRLPSLPCESEQLVSATPVEQWIPTKQDYEGYTGNAGNTLDRWYHKSAIILWPNSQRFNVITQMGLGFAICKFLELVPKRSKLKSEKLANATLECIEFARAIIGKWPDRTHSSSSRDETDSLFADFSEALPQLESSELVGEFLQMVTRRDRQTDLTKLIKECWRSLGRDLTFPLIKDLLLYEPQPNKYGIIFNAGLAERDAVWLCKLSKAQLFSQVSDFSVLLGIAIRKLVTQLKCLTTGDYRTRSEPPTSAWLQLILACLNGHDESQLKELLHLADEFPKIFELREVQVPAAIKLKTWKCSTGDRLPDPVVNWVELVRQKLKVATQSKPQLPKDETRSANMNCQCEYCNQLRDFLRDSEQLEIEIKAAEQYRNHMESTIRSQSLDLTSKKIPVGNRYALRFIKTTASYTRALKRYEDDLKLLARLESA
jgi:predicted 2-oxoglutarate/Fe(II)-dependent dioxygenase YbiX